MSKVAGLRATKNIAGLTDARKILRLTDAPNIFCRRDMRRVLSIRQQIARRRERCVHGLDGV